MNLIIPSKEKIKRAGFQKLFMVSIQYIFQIFKKNLNFLTVHLERFCDNKNLFFENGRQKMNLIINFLKNEKIWILKTICGKHLICFSDF